MRAGWIVPGVIMMLIMAILLYVPLPAAYTPGSSSSQCLQGDISNQCYLVLPCPSILPTSSSSSCLAGLTPLDLSWSGGNASTWVELMPCHNPTCRDVNTTPTIRPRMPHEWSIVAWGTSGSLSTWVPTNESFAVLTNSTTAISITVVLNSMPEFHAIWGIFVLIGILLAVVGLLLPKHPRPKRRLGKPSPKAAPRREYIREELPPDPNPEPVSQEGYVPAPSEEGQLPQS